MNNFGTNVVEDGCGNDTVVVTKNLEEYVMDIQNGKRNIVSNMIIEWIRGYTFVLYCNQLIKCFSLSK